MFKKLFNIRTGLIVLFSVLLVSYGVLAIFYVNSLYSASTASPNPPVDVIVQQPYDAGSTIKVPTTITAGEPFVFTTRGEKLVDNGGMVSYQLNCIIGGATQRTTINTFYSNQPKGSYDVKRSMTIPVLSTLQSADKCELQSVATYTFYTDNKGDERSFDVVETGASNSFKLVVPDDQK